MSRKPDQLHGFYTENSHYLHGVEGEEASVLQGQVAIHKSLEDIGFENCRVFMSTFDAHTSANDGILIHVIGEMSNKKRTLEEIRTSFLPRRTTEWLFHHERQFQVSQRGNFE